MLRTELRGSTVEALTKTRSEVLQNTNSRVRAAVHSLLWHLQCVRQPKDAGYPIQQPLEQSVTPRHRMWAACGPPCLSPTRRVTDTDRVATMHPCRLSTSPAPTARRSLSDIDGATEAGTMDRATATPRPQVAVSDADVSTAAAFSCASSYFFVSIYVFKLF